MDRQMERPMVRQPGKRAWSQRHFAYKIGIACLIVGTLAYALGHVAPFWIRQEATILVIPAIPSVDSGIWYGCVDGGSCGGAFFENSDYLKATRVLEVIGFAGLALSLVMALILNCRREKGPIVLLEVVVILSAAIGFSGAMVYVGNTRDTVSNFLNITYNWAFAVNVAGSVLALLAGVIIFFANICSDKNDRSTSTQSGFMDYKQDYREDDDGYMNGRAPQYVDQNGRPYPAYPGPGAGPYTAGPFCPLPHNHHLKVRSDPSRPYNPSPSRDYRNDVDDDVRYASPSSRQNLLLKTVDSPDRSFYSNRGYHDGMEMAVVSPPNDRRYKEDRDRRDYPPSPSAVQYYPQPSRASYPPVVDSQGGFALPRVIVRGYYEPGNRGYHDGMEMAVVSPPNDRRYKEDRDRRDYPPSPSAVQYYPQPSRASYPPVVDSQGGFALPRVIVRGYYEPGYGYPEYIMT